MPRHADILRARPFATRGTSFMGSVAGSGSPKAHHAGVDLEAMMYCSRCGFCPPDDLAHTPQECVTAMVRDVYEKLLQGKFYVRPRVVQFHDIGAVTVYEILCDREG